MTTQEMHIEIDLELQKINSQSTKNLLPQEKDWFLNKEVIKYLHSKTSPSSNVKQLGFEDTAKRVEDIRDLVRVVNRPIEVNSQGKSFVTLPFDYFGYIRFDAYSYKKCSTTIAESTTKTVYKATFKVELPAENLTTYSIDLVKTTGVTNLFTLEDLPTGYLTNSEFKKQEFLLIKALKIKLLAKLKAALDTDVSLYWEKEGYTYNTNSFTIVSDTPFTFINVTTNDIAVNKAVSTKTVTMYAKSITPLKAKTRIIDDEFLTDVENSHLSRSQAYSPISVLRENSLELSETLGAIFGSIDIVYICLPNIIDLLLNSNLNVSDKVAKEIVTNTVRTLKGLLQDKDYQTYAQESMLTE